MKDINSYSFVQKNFKPFSEIDAKSVILLACGLNLLFMTHDEEHKKNLEWRMQAIHFLFVSRNLQHLQLCQ